MPSWLLILLGLVWLVVFIAYRRSVRKRSASLMAVPGATRTMRGGGGL